MVKIIAVISFLFVSVFAVAQSDSLNALLWEASWEGNDSAVVSLLNQGANINSYSSDDVTALMYASQNGHLKTVKILVFNGADVNLKPEYGRTALINAVMFNHFDVVKFLIENGANIDKSDFYGITSLMYSIGFGLDSLSNYLLEKGANVNMKTQNGTDAIQIAAYVGNTEMVYNLLMAGANINSSDDAGFTALMGAVQNNNSYTIEYLLQNKADASLNNSYGDNVIDLAVSNCPDSVVNFLLNNHTFSDSVLSHSLDIAIANNNLKIAKTLKRKLHTQFYLPSYNSFYLGYSFAFNSTDFWMGLDAGVLDRKLNTSVTLSYLFRPGGKRVLVPWYDDVYFQYWEKRRDLSLRFDKRFNLICKKSISVGLNIGGRGLYTFGRYTGTTAKPTDYLKLSPLGGIYISGRTLLLQANYEYIDFKTLNLSPHRINISLGFVIPPKLYMVEHKYIDWL